MIQTSGKTLTLVIFWNAHSADSLKMLLEPKRLLNKKCRRKCRLIGIVGNPVKKAVQYLKQKSIQFCNFYDIDEALREYCDIEVDEEPIFWFVEENGYVKLQLQGWNEENKHKIEKYFRQCNI